VNRFFSVLAICIVLLWASSDFYFAPESTVGAIKSRVGAWIVMNKLEESKNPNVCRMMHIKLDYFYMCTKIPTKETIGEDIFLSYKMQVFAYASYNDAVLVMYGADFFTLKLFKGGLGLKEIPIRLQRPLLPLHVTYKTTEAVKIGSVDIQGSERDIKII